MQQIQIHIMDNIDPPSSPPHVNYQELVDVFCFTGVSSLNSTMWFMYGRVYQFLCVWNFCWFIMLSSALQQSCLPSVSKLECGFVFLKFAYLMLDLRFEHVIFVLGLTFVIIGFVGTFLFLIVVWWSRKHYQGNSGTRLISDRMFMMILHILCIVFVNGYTILCYWYIKKASHVWQRLGFVLIGVLGFLTMIGCILRLLSRWQEYRRSQVRVLSMSDSNEGV